MNKILITGASTYGVENHGDDAMLASLIASLRKKFKKVDIVFICRHPNKSFDKLYNIRSIKNLDHDFRKDSIGRFFFGFNEFDKSAHLKKIIDEIKNANALVIGGNIFMEIFSNSFLKGTSSYGATMAIIARMFSVPIYIYGLNIVKNINSEVTKEHLKFILNIARKITVREQQVIERIKKIGINNYKKILVTGDPAFGLDLSYFKINKKKFVKKKKLVIGLNLRYEYHLGTSPTKVKNFINFYKNVLKKLNKAFDASFILIPNCTYEKANKFQNDIFVHSLITKGLKLSNVKTIKKKLNLPDTLEIFNHIDIHITNRRHSFIFSLLKGKPALLINVHKTVEYHLKSLVNELNMKDFLLEKNLNTSLELINKINYILKHYKKVNMKIKKNLTSLKKTNQKIANFFFS